MMRHITAAAAVAAALLLSGCLPTNSKPVPTTAVQYQTQTASAAGDDESAALPSASEFRLQVIELERKCFGSAGCNVSYRIQPIYLGAGDPPTSRFTILWALSGADDTATGSITVANGRFTREEGYVSAEQGAALTAEVTAILPG